MAMDKKEKMMASLNEYADMVVAIEEKKYNLYRELFNNFNLGLDVYYNCDIKYELLDVKQSGIIHSICVDYNSNVWIYLDEDREERCNINKLSFKDFVNLYLTIYNYFRNTISDREYVVSAYEYLKCECVRMAEKGICDLEEVKKRLNGAYIDEDKSIVWVKMGDLEVGVKLDNGVWSVYDEFLLCGNNVKKFNHYIDLLY